MESKLRLSLMALLLCLAFSVTTATSFAASDDNSGFFRYPDIRGDLVVFTSEGDLWSTSLSNGGLATRLTRDNGEESYARISPDGKWIAFSGEYDGNKDIYITPAMGGEAVRLSFHPAVDEVTGWTADSKNIIFRSNRDQANRDWNLYSVPVKGGAPMDIGLDKGTRISYEPKGDRFAYTRLRREVRPWKRYKGGWAMDIWQGNLKTQQFKKLTKFDGTDAFPMWVADRIYFTSDRSGRTNIFSMDANGGGIQQHTFEDKYDVRFPSTDGMKIVFQLAMDIWSYDIATGKTSKVNIDLPSDRFQARERIINPGKYIDYASIPDNGKRVAFAARGDVFTFPVEEKGYVRRLTRSEDSRERYVAFSPDGKTVAMMSDASGEDEIWLAPSDGSEEPKQLTKGGSMWRFPMTWSPDGENLLFADKKGVLWLADAKSGKLTKVSDTSAWEIRSYEWAPDSKWIAWAESAENWYQDIWVYNLDTKKKHRVSKEMTNDYDVTWDPEGKYLYYLADSWFNPVTSVVDETHIYNRTTKVHMILLKKDTENPFAPSLVEAFEEDEEEKKDDKKKDDKEDEEEEEGVKVEIDFDGILDRIYVMPIDANNYGSLVGTKGRIYYGSWDNWGMMDEEDHKKGLSFYTYDLEKKEVEEIGKIKNLSVSADKAKFLVQDDGGTWMVMDAGSTKLPEEDGKVDTGDWTMTISPRAEWRQILREVWRWQRDFFYDPDMHGVDWDGVWKQYSELLPRITTRADLNDLISEMIGELNIGHAYVWGGDMLDGNHVRIGLLGADLKPHSSGAYEVTHVLYGDGWGDEPVSPLAPSLGNVQEGEYIVAVDGVELKSGDNIYRHLVDKSGVEVMLSVNSSPKMSGARDVLVKTMGSESKLRYLDWVRDRREYVEKQTNGKVAYVHMPEMMTMGLSMWGRMYLAQNKKEGLIIDVRYNGGGFIAEQVLSMLQRDVWSRGKGRETPIYHRPNSAFYGPMVALCNHEAGSDAETFSEGFKRLNLGKLIGTRTWGGWVGIRGGRPTVDRGGNTQPEFSGWGALDGKWLIEGTGVYPDIEVVDEPAKRIAGEDPQLDRAILEVTNAMKTWPKLADPPAYPDKSIEIKHMK
ncbi:PDZ domain-containing protein [bacterium]|nr:PDZ domain-containing protein [bacterium]